MTYFLPVKSCCPFCLFLFLFVLSIPQVLSSECSVLFLLGTPSFGSRPRPSGISQRVTINLRQIIQSID